MKSLEAAKNLPIDTTAVVVVSTTTLRQLKGNFFGLEVILRVNLQHWAFGKQIFGRSTCFLLCYLYRASPFPFLGLICTCSCRSTAVPRDSGSISRKLRCIPLGLHLEVRRCLHGHRCHLHQTHP